jgi:hypothetical protein
MRPPRNAVRARRRNVPRRKRRDVPGMTPTWTARPNVQIRRRALKSFYVNSKGNLDQLDLADVHGRVRGHLLTVGALVALHPDRETWLPTTGVEVLTQDANAAHLRLGDVHQRLAMIVHDATQMRKTAAMVIVAECHDYIAPVGRQS